MKHYTKAEHLGDVEVAGASGVSFSDSDSLYISRAISKTSPNLGGIVSCTISLAQTDFLTTPFSYYSVAGGPNGSVAVRNETANELEFYSKERVKVFNMELPTGKQKGIAIDGQGHIYVCDSESDCVRVYESSGNLSRVITSPDIRKPQNIALMTNAVVVTCHGDAPATVCLDNTNELLWENDDLEEPVGVAVDDNNDVYVCDVDEGKVIMVTNDGEMTFDMLDEEQLQRGKPSDVAVSGNKMAVQLLNKDMVKLFRLTS
ncbi:tripartite motif-containing protein 3-like [Watersipora subatra]|uniref:tripartite motif-containing protein 3-like n=1 Tax=Watersipora subatra TaxID=2589382 RepID=UPI00355AD401